jgi:hypothetical protein
LSQTYREPPEQAKYLWEEGHGFHFPEKEHGEGEEEPMETTMDRRGKQEGESSSEENQ